MPNSKNRRKTLPCERMSQERWYCVQTAPTRETLAAEYLRSKDLHVYNPVLPVRSGTRRPEPLFPRYLFVRFVLNRDWEAVRYGHGVTNVVSDMEGPLPVEDEIIEEIRRRIDRGFYSRTNLETGERIVVESGAFKGISGMFNAYVSGRERVRVLMEMMNRSVVVELDISEIKKYRRQSTRDSNCQLAS